MHITITMMNGESHNLSVNPQDTVSSLKQLIQSKLGVSVQEQKLAFNGAQRTPLNDDSRPLSSYGLQSGSQVSLLITQLPPVQVAQLPPVQVAQPPPVQVAQPPPIQLPRFQVFLINEKGQSSAYEITPEETVAHFMDRVEKREGVPVSQQRLLHQGRQMTGGRLTDYNVTNHSTIHMMLRLRGG